MISRERGDSLAFAGTRAGEGPLLRDETGDLGPRVGCRRELMVEVVSIDRPMDPPWRVSSNTYEG